MSALRAVLERYGRTQSELSKLLGSKTRASDYIHGRRAPTVKSLRLLRYEWGIPLDELLGIEVARSPALPTIPADDETLSYVLQYGGRCRECADHVGVCTTGLPCEPDEARKAVKHIIAALNYGFKHGFLPAPETRPTTAEPTAYDWHDSHNLAFSIGTSFEEICTQCGVVQKRGNEALMRAPCPSALAEERRNDG